MNIATLSTQLQRGAAHPLIPGLAIAGLAFAVLAGAYAFEYLGALKPCPLCLEQRGPWFVLIAIGGAIYSAGMAKAPRNIVMALYAGAIVIALWSAYLGGFHAGVEYKWWPGPQSCTGGGLPLDGGLIGPISQSDIVWCDQVPWAMFGISLAGFNFLLSLIAGALGGLGFRTALTEKR
ncbi:MAG: disulfide bond formation protein B [Alphaproteobacteria bacterium]|nr:disulfide bond formation protein B [Alphaproteobacteria bacterium]